MEKNGYQDGCLVLTRVVPRDELEAADSWTTAESIQTDFDLVMTAKIEAKDKKALDRLKGRPSGPSSLTTA